MTAPRIPRTRKEAFGGNTVLHDPKPESLNAVDWLLLIGGFSGLILLYIYG